MREIVIRWAGLAAMGLALAWGASRIALAIFGQTSPFRAQHAMAGTVLLLAYLWLGRRRRGAAASVTFFLAALLPVYLGTALSDLDIGLLGIGGHRNPLFHSALAYGLLLLFLRPAGALPRAALIGFGLGLASHLLLDVVDYGNVRWLPGGTADRLWLTVNGLACLLPPRRPLAGQGAG